MQVTRLRRQKLHTFVCVSILSVIVCLLIWYAEGPNVITIVLAILYAVSGICTQFFLIAIRTYKDLVVRHSIGSTLLTIVAIVAGIDVVSAVKLFVWMNLIYMAWLVLAKGWIRHQIAPGWTMLVYDSSENEDKAKKISDSRADLILDACHLQLSEGEDALEKVRKTVNIYHVTQVVLCITADSDGIYDFCREKGISVFTHDDSKRICAKGYKINKDGLYLIMPEVSV